MESLLPRYFKLLLQIRNNNYVQFCQNHENLFQEAKKTGDYTGAIKHYYSMMAPIIEAGYGASWQFIPKQHAKQSRSEAIRHLHHLIAKKIALAPGKHGLDIGCGVGGVLQEIAAYSGGRMTGVALSQEECHQANTGIKKKNLEKLCQVVQGNNLQLPFQENTFDSAYAIYSFKYLTSELLQKGFSEAYRVLKPGSSFLIYDAVLSKGYVPHHPDHARVTEQFVYSTAMPPLHTLDEILDSARRSGLQVISQTDFPEGIKWHYCLKDSRLFSWILSSKAIDQCIHLLERTHFFSEGFLQFYKTFIAGSVKHLIEFGEKDIASFSQLVVFKKP